MWEPLQATLDPGRGLPLLVGPLWWKGYRPRVRPKREPKGTKRFEAIYQRQQDEIVWVTVLWMVAQLNEYWMGHNFPPLPSVFQINCGGLGGLPLQGLLPRTSIACVLPWEKVKLWAVTLPGRCPQRSGVGGCLWLVDRSA